MVRVAAAVGVQGSEVGLGELAYEGTCRLNIGNTAACYCDSAHMYDIHHQHLLLQVGHAPACQFAGMRGACPVAVI